MQVADIYLTKENIEEELVHRTGNRCYVFFSSNGLYNTDDLEEFNNKIVQADYYEWKSLAIPLKKHKDVGKIIYVRDVYVTHYLYGTCQQLNSIDKVVSRLQQMIEGYEVITVGISSGGYMAVISGCLLSAHQVFCISGQFDLSKKYVDKQKEFANNEDKKKYLNIVDIPMQHSEVPIYYLCPIRCLHDKFNYEMIKDLPNVFSFLFPEEKHAATVYPFNFPDLLYLSNKKLRALYTHYKDKEINKNVFYLRTVSIYGAINFLVRMIKKRFDVREMKKDWNI